MDDDFATTTPEEIKTLEQMSDTHNTDIYEEIFGIESDIEDEEELQPIGRALNKPPTMLTSQVIGEPEKDIGVSSNDTSNTIDENRLQSIHEHTLNEIYKVIGVKQLTRSKMACALSWILYKALQEELDTNWKDTHIEVDERDIEQHANVIPSHVVHKVKMKKRT